jgi:hypothetical protein
MTPAAGPAVGVAEAWDRLHSFSGQHGNQPAFGVGAGNSFYDAKAPGERQQVVDVPEAIDLAPFEIADMALDPRVDGGEG